MDRMVEAGADTQHVGVHITEPSYRGTVG